MVNNLRYEKSLVVLPEHLHPDWSAVSLESLSVQAIAEISALHPEIVLLGTGFRQRFPHASVFRALIDAGLGYEVMDNAAACRTYNVLMSEDRKVAAALIL